jgi:hypothetical protein
MVMAASTNLVNLRRRPLFVLAASPFFVLETRSLAGFAASCVAVYAPLERKTGPRRWCLAFAAGHAGVSIMTVAALRVMRVFGGADRSEVEDVGTSFASRTLMAASVYLLHRPWREIAGAGLLAGHVRGAWRLRGFSDAGHLLCVLLGLRLGGWLVDKDSTRAVSKSPPKEVKSS